MYACDVHPECHSKKPGECKECDNIEFNEIRRKRKAEEKARLERIEGENKASLMEGAKPKTERKAKSKPKPMDSHVNPKLYGKRPGKAKTVVSSAIPPR